MMFDGHLFRPVFRGLRVAALAAVVHLTSSFIHAAAPSAVIVGVESAPAADIVLVGNGFNAGLRQGMVCRVSRGNAEIGEILLVDLRATFGAALILNVAPNESIRPGDLASVKVLKS